MSAHLYWRLLLQIGGGPPMAAIAKIEMRAAPGGSDLCSGGTPFADYTNSGSAAANAFDASASTYWILSGNPAVGIGYRFSSAATVAEIAVTFASSIPSGFSFLGIPAAIQVQWSDDGAVWTTVPPAVAPGVQAAGATITIGPIDSFGAATARSFRLRTPDTTSSLRPYAVRDLPARFDFYDGGPYRVAGDVAIDGAPALPVQRRVRLLDRKTARLVRETWSAAGSGAFSFEKLAMNEYLVVTDDYTRFFNAVAADAVVPTL